MYRAPIAIVVTCALVGAACSPAPPPAPARDSGDTPLAGVLRAAVQRHQPAVLRSARRPVTRYVWLLADGRGRIARSALSAARPRADELRDVLREKFPGIDTDAWVRDVPEALFPVGGIYRFRPGELGPDTVLVFWAEPPVPVGTEPPRQLGPYHLGPAAAVQFSPTRVRRLAREAARGQTVWFVEADDGELLEVGLYAGDRDYDAIRALLQPRFPGRAIQCSAGFSLPGPDGRLVPTVAVRLGAPAG